MSASPDQLSYFVDKDREQRKVGLPEGRTIEEKKNSTYKKLASPNGLSINIERKQNGEKETLNLIFKYRRQQARQLTGLWTDLRIYNGGTQIAGLYAQIRSSDGSYEAYNFEKDYHDSPQKNLQKEYRDKGIIQFATSVFLFCLAQQGITSLSGYIRSLEGASFASRSKIPDLFDLTFETTAEESSGKGFFIVKTSIKKI